MRSEGKDWLKNGRQAMVVLLLFSWVASIGGLERASVCSIPEHQSCILTTDDMKRRFDFFVCDLLFSINFCDQTLIQRNREQSKERNDVDFVFTHLFVTFRAYYATCFA